MIPDLPYGYLVPYGYMGMLSDGQWQLFETEEAYLEYVRSTDEDIQYTDST